MFAVDAIRVGGASGPVTAIVQHELRRYEGRSLVGLDASRIEQRVDALPAVRSATVDRSFPHTLTIRVVPELPVAVVRRGSDSFLVSARGRVIAPVGRGTYRALPRIWLPSTTDIELGSFLGGEDGGLAARSLATFVGSGFPGRVTFVRARRARVPARVWRRVAARPSRGSTAQARDRTAHRHHASVPDAVRRRQRSGATGRRHEPSSLNWRLIVMSLDLPLTWTRTARTLRPRAALHRPNAVLQLYPERA